MTHLILLAVCCIVLGPILLGFVAIGRVLPRLCVFSIGAGVVLAVVAAATAPGVYFSNHTYLMDIWVVMDGANRIAHGQLSSIDYPNPIGPLFTWILGLATVLRGLTIHALPMANALVAILAIAASFLMLRRQVTPLALVLCALIAAAAAVSPRETQSTFAELETSFLAPYNRWGWALLAPVALRLLAPAHRPDLLGAMVLGVVIAGLLLLKVSYGAAAIGLLILATVLRPGGWRDLAGAVSGALIALAVVEIITGQVSANLADLAAVSSLPYNGLRVGRLPRLAGEAGIYAGAAVLILALRSAGGGAPFRDWTTLRAALLLLAGAGAGAAILMQNHDYYGATLYPVLLVAAAEWAGLRRVLSEDLVARTVAGTRVVAVGVLLLIVLTVRVPLSDIGLAMAQHYWVRATPEAPALSGTPLADLRIDPAQMPRDVVGCRTVTCSTLDWVARGRTLLREAGADKPGAGAVLTLSFSNPFPLLLRSESPRHVPLWLDFGRSFGPEILPPPERFFDEVSFVMLMPRSGLSQWPEAYAAYISAEFAPAGRTGDWQVLRRN